ncbi:MAG: M23 family metallopeptidase [Oscillospiraceae bacterium]
MPLKRNNKREHNNGDVKKVSRLKMMFKHYNQDKITIKSLQDFFGALFYEVGCCVEMQWLIVARAAWKVCSRIAKAAVNIFAEVSLFLDKFSDTVLDDLGEPLERLEIAIVNITDIIKDARGDKNRKAIKEVKKYVKQGMSKHHNLALELYRYAAPVATALIFVIVVSVNFNREYAIEVILDNEPIGTIASYSVLENADKIIKNKLVSTENQKWELNSSIKMVSMSNKDILDERRLADNILSASDENILEATGLYMDGNFYGAVKEAEPLNDAINSLKAPYENGDSNRTVSFVQDVSVTDGIFFTDSVVPEEKLLNLVKGEISGEKRYTVVTGDSPSKIAQKNGITLNELYRLNPNMKGSGMWPGDECLVGASVPFLQVKYVEHSVREVAVPHKTKTEKNNSMNMGTTKVSQKGVDGVNEQTVETTYVDGIYQSETITQTVVVSEPVTEIIQSGTLWNGTVIAGGTGRCIWPVSGGGRLSRGFAGQYPSHNGLDIAAPYGTPIMAADSGVVVSVKYGNRGYGIHMIIEHGGYQTLYGHCSAILVSQGQQVSKGQVVARMGSTGNSTGNHLHFEVKKGDWRYDPKNWM